jgi:hypothetical protein
VNPQEVLEGFGSPDILTLAFAILHPYLFIVLSKGQNLSFATGVKYTIVEL